MPTRGVNELYLLRFLSPILAPLRGRLNHPLKLNPKFITGIKSFWLTFRPFCLLDASYYLQEVRLCDVRILKGKRGGVRSVFVLFPRVSFLKVTYLFQS